LVQSQARRYVDFLQGNTPETSTREGGASREEFFELAGVMARRPAHTKGAELLEFRVRLPDQLRRSLACTNMDRECHGHGSTRLPKREALALVLDGDALDRSRYGRGIEGLPEFEGPQTTCACSQSPLGATSKVRFK
jgi:hypothetical protein